MPWTIGAVADHFGVSPWQVRRLFERAILPPASRVGPYRVIDPTDLPKIAAALREVGYLAPENANESRPEADGRGVSP
jgi:DNA-binding transcriptional MerR regulator